MGKPKSVLMGVIGFIILVLADQWTKKMAVLRLKDQDPIVLIKNVLNFIIWKTVVQPLAFFRESV